MNIHEISKEINDNAHAKGFWKDGIDVPQKLMLIVSEAAEALEADRKDRYAKLSETNMNVLNGWVENAEFVKHYEKKVKGTFEEEMADLAIRIFDLCFEKKLICLHTSKQNTDIIQRASIFTGKNINHAI